jgi:organic hydroperoxide reductase OsmC/OhrA
MAQYVAEIFWLQGGQDFLSNPYRRLPVLRFHGGEEVPGSSSPHVVPAHISDPCAVDPDEAFVTTLSSGHMLWFLYIPAKRRFVWTVTSTQRERRL